MLQKLKNKLKNQKGFTLVELLAVIVILGIIAAIAVPAISNIIDNAESNAELVAQDMVVEAARLADANNVGPNDSLADTDSTPIYTVEFLIQEDYLDVNINDDKVSLKNNDYVKVTENGFEFGEGAEPDSEV